MSPKPSNNLQSDRPESGGADKDMQREKSGLLNRDKAKFASDEAAKHRAAIEHENIESGLAANDDRGTEDPRRS